MKFVPYLNVSLLILDPPLALLFDKVHLHPFFARSGCFSSQMAYFERQNVYIFGHNLRNANLMDFMFATDDYKVEIEASSDRCMTLTSFMLEVLLTFAQCLKV